MGRTQLSPYGLYVPEVNFVLVDFKILCSFYGSFHLVISDIFQVVMESRFSINITSINENYSPINIMPSCY